MALDVGHLHGVQTHFMSLSDKVLEYLVAELEQTPIYGCSNWFNVAHATCINPINFHVKTEVCQQRIMRDMVIIPIIIINMGVLHSAGQCLHNVVLFLFLNETNAKKALLRAVS